MRGILEINFKWAFWDDFKKKMIGHRQYVKHVHANNTNSIFVFASKGEDWSPLKKKNVS